QDGESGPSTHDGLPSQMQMWGRFATGRPVANRPHLLSQLAYVDVAEDHTLGVTEEIPQGNVPFGGGLAVLDRDTHGRIEYELAVDRHLDLVAFALDR